MNKNELQAIAQAAAKNIKTEQDLNEFRQILTKITVEAALNAELDDHLGYSRHEKANTDNSRNGFTSKTLQTEDGSFELKTPRDRNGDFEPELVKKKQRRFTLMSDNILFLYAQGMTTREIVKTFKEMYDADAFEQFAERWDDKYPQISKSWRAHWHNLNTLFNYPQDIRKAIYTTNAIESLNSVIRKAIKKRKLFPTDDTAKKVVYLAIQEASKKWTMPIRNWKAALNRFMIEFEDRLTDYI